MTHRVFHKLTELVRPAERNVALEQGHKCSRLIVLSVMCAHRSRVAESSHHSTEQPRKRRIPTALDHAKFFLRLGMRIRGLRKQHGYSQEDMISQNFSARHWQQMEAGRPITVSTLLRVCAALRISIDRLVRGLDKGIYRGKATPPLIRSW